MKKFEVRQVAENWEHPIDHDQNFIPLLDGLSYRGRLKFWQTGAMGWNPNFYFYEEGVSYEEWAGPQPVPSQHMPDWPASERKYLIMYDVSTNDGVPISPMFETAESLSQWLSDNQVSWGWFLPKTYVDWLEIATRDDVENDQWYDHQIMTRAAMNAVYKGNAEEAKAITLKYRDQVMGALSDHQKNTVD